MKERPILFNSEMVRAILDGRKTQTRRPINKQREEYKHIKPGDVLWVRESARVMRYDPVFRVICLKYLADDHGAVVDYYPDRLKAPKEGYCCPNGIFREAARLFLKAKTTHIERLQDITEADAIAEGIETFCHYGDTVFRDYSGEIFCTSNPRYSFETLWDSCYAKRGLGWDVEQDVRVIEFERVEAAR